MPETDLSQVYAALATLLKRHANDLQLLDRVPGSQASSARQELHLYGKTPVAIFGRAPQPVYVAGIITHKSYVGFYLMPLYSHPGHFALSPALAKVRKGKSCLHISSAAPGLLAELEQLLSAAVALYQELGWV